MYSMHMQKKTKNYFNFYLWMYWVYCGWKWKGVYIYIEVFCAFVGVCMSWKIMRICSFKWTNTYGTLIHFHTNKIKTSCNSLSLSIFCNVILLPFPIETYFAHLQISILRRILKIPDYFLVRWYFWYHFEI